MSPERELDPSPPYHVPRTNRRSRRCNARAVFLLPLVRYAYRPARHLTPYMETRCSTPTALLRHRACVRQPGSVFPVDDVICEAVERSRCVAKLGDGRLGLVDQLLRNLSRPIEAEQLGVGRLIRVEILTCSLAELLCARREIQDVVGNLEGEPDLQRVLIALLHLLVGGTRKDGTARDRRLEQRGRLVRVDPHERVIRDLNTFTLALQVHHLAAS
mmetsp:Transcript_3640/g.7717  ORF Transcript_3640/g.7717 Transcript_3640/m.7717 type:complete len:216 (-) Transcript_3640:624-1271(-)